jgi:hypothetical protein
MKGLFKSPWFWIILAGVVALALMRKKVFGTAAWTKPPEKGESGFDPSKVYAA